MTTPPQGSGDEGGSDANGGQPGQGGGWQQPGQHQGQQPSQQHGQPPGPQTGQPVQQGQNTWQQPGQQAQGGWGQTAALPAQDAYQQQSWGQQPWGGQQSQPPGDWQQQPWQPPGGGGDDNRKMLMIIGGGVVGVLVLGLLIFLGVRALGGGDDEAGPTVETSGQPTDVGNSTGQAKAATDALAAQGYECADLFNTPQGGHRGCFRSAGTTDAEVIFQFSLDGTVIGMQVYSYDTENTNTARKAFDGALNAIGGQAFSQEIPKVQAAVNGGQKHTDVKLGWGELRLSNNGDSLRLTGGKNGTDALEVPRKQFDNNETAFKAALKAKGYQCPSYCKKGGYGTGQASTYVNAYGSSDSGLRSVTVDSSGDGNAARTAFSGSATDVMSILKGDDVAALQAWVKAHVHGKSHSSYVNGWRVELSARMGSSGYGDIELEIKNESYYV